MANYPIAYSIRLNEMIGAFKTALDDWNLPFIVGGMPEWTEGAYAVKMQGILDAMPDTETAE